jgi:hypothetical protein
MSTSTEAVKFRTVRKAVLRDLRHRYEDLGRALLQADKKDYQVLSALHSHSLLGELLRECFGRELWRQLDEEATKK